MSREVGDRLDALAEAVFGGELGRKRVVPLFARFDALVGAPRPDDEDQELLHAIRTDWALCDAWIDGRIGDTWARRAARGEVPGLAAEEEYAGLAGSVARLFEIWPGRPTQCRDTLGGLVLRLADPVEGLEPVRGAPAALWELRLVMQPAGARMCRAPIQYPVELVSELAQGRDCFPADPAARLRRLQRAHLIWARSRGRSRFVLR